jgi:hypothetical protein
MNDMKTGICRRCEEQREVYPDTGLCEECDGDVIRCKICRSEEDADNHCRHVFQNQDFEWCGSGVGWLPGERTGIRLSFFALLDLMPAGFAADLRTAIRSGKFHTWFMAPLIGCGGVMEMHGMPDRDGRSMFTAWGDRMFEIGVSEDAEMTADGYHWLASLFDRKTKRANQLTVAWIDEWLGARDHYSRWADDGGRQREARP